MRDTFIRTALIMEPRNQVIVQSVDFILVVDGEIFILLRKIKHNLPYWFKMHKELLLPEFDLRYHAFILYYDRDNNQQITLCNLLTGYRCTLVSGSAKNRNEYPATFFIKRGPGFELNFCTSVTLSNGFDHSWHRW